MLSSGFTKQLAILDINITLTFLKKLSTIRVHFWCLKYYKRNFIVLMSVMWMPKTKPNGLNFGMAIDSTKMHCISQNCPSLILHLMIGYQSMHIGHIWKKTIEELQSIFFISSSIACRCAYSLWLSPNLEVCGF